MAVQGICPRWLSITTRSCSLALTRLRYKIEYSAVGFRLMPECFTLSELQSAYEIILGEPLDKRNFRRRIIEAEIIEPTDDLRYRRGTSGAAVSFSARRRG